MDMIEFCRPAVMKICTPIVDNPKGLVTLKGEERITNKFEGFFNGFSAFTIYDSKTVKNIIRSPSDSTIRAAVRYFDHNGERIFRKYIDKCYEGSIESAMWEAGTMNALMNSFKAYYKSEREGFMENVDKMLAEIKKSSLAAGKTKLPQSHGGVANLLKVLTKTMSQQGANITSIAKMQYTICMQAGIYVPDEFITDVLVARDIIEA